MFRAERYNVKGVERIRVLDSFQRVIYDITVEEYKAKLCVC
jgi:hypothetical protein